jgi:transposase
MAALVATRHNPSIRDFYTRLRRAGKPAKVALVACMRKLLVLCNSYSLEGHHLLTSKTVASRPVPQGTC